MSRSSRIPRTPSSRFVKIYASDVRRFGLAVAAVISEIEFLDRAQELPGQPVANRKRLIHDLDGLVGRDLVDKALRMLQEAHVIKAHSRTERGEKNWQRHVEYGLDMAGLGRMFPAAVTPEIRSSGDSGEQDSRVLLNIGRKSGAPSNIEEGEVTTTTHHPVVVEDLDDLIHAAVWSASLTRPIISEVGFRAKKRKRLVEEGPNDEDLLALRAWRASTKAAREQHEASLERQERERADAAKHEQQRAARAVEASAYLQSLSSTAHAAVIEAFAAYLATENGYAYQYYRRDGLKSRVVESALVTFVASRYLECSRQGVAA